MSKICLHAPRKRKMRDWIIVSILYAVTISLFIGIWCLFNKDQIPIENYFISYREATTLVEVKYDYSHFFGPKIVVGFMDDNSYEQYKNGTYEKDTIKIYHPYIKGKSSIISTDSITTMYKVTQEYIYHHYPPNQYAK